MRQPVAPPTATIPRLRLIKPRLLTPAAYRVLKVTDVATGSLVAGRAAEGAGPFDPTRDPHTDPATDPWFYLDQNNGEVVLTTAGAAAHGRGRSPIITVQAVTDDTQRAPSHDGPGPGSFSVLFA
jgi:hypothetical protein